MMESFKQNTFSRTLYNEAKLGAYYTDLAHCSRIANLLAFPEDAEVCVLEPSIGDGKAVLEVTKNCPKRQIFGVELNNTTYDKIKDRKEEFPYLLNEDFLNGIKVSHCSFSFCFANPPYGVSQDGNERLEKLFIEKIYTYLKVGAIFVAVIPLYCIQEERVRRAFCARFNPIAAFRFDDAEYAKFKQVVIIGERRDGIGCSVNSLEIFSDAVADLEQMAYLPEGEVEKRIPVPASESANIEYFTTLRFDDLKAGERIAESGLFSVIGEKGVVQPYTAAEIGRPPVPLKKDLMYICAISGGGQGLCGSEEDGDLHLQRGVVKTDTKQDLHISDDENEVDTVTETSFSKISLNIIENDGTITTLS